MIIKRLLERYKWGILRLIHRHYMIKYGIQIPYATRIGEGFYIGHFGELVINENATIGRDCNIAHNVTIGQSNRGVNKGTPHIGDYVWIGTGSVIVGAITIGNNVLIAPNSYVNLSIPDNSIFINGHIKSRNDATKDYINWCV